MILFHWFFNVLSSYTLEMICRAWLPSATGIPAKLREDRDGWQTRCSRVLSVTSVPSRLRVCRLDSCAKADKSLTWQSNIHQDRKKSWENNKTINGEWLTVSWEARSEGRAEVPSSAWCWGAAVVAHSGARLPVWLQLQLSGSGWVERGRTELTGDTAPSQHQSLWCGPGTRKTGSLNLVNTGRRK